MFTTIALLSALTVPASGVPLAAHPVYRPRIELWTNRGDGAVYTRGERVRVYFTVDRDAYVTLFRVDTDGRVRVLFPREPWEDNFARGGREFEVEGRSSDAAFQIDDYPGVGYVFAVAAADPFDYGNIESGDHWDYRVIADGRVRGDPYVALTDLAQRIVPEGYSDWDYDLVSYDVERHYDYPRFLCYDCHSYASYSYWNPYYYSCVRFRMVIYDDPWYYPYRYYGGTRVVFVRPYRPQPRFIFKDWDGGRPNRDGFVTRERERPQNDNTRRGVTGRDIGGIGIIPPPDVRERRDRPGQPDRPGNPDRPDRPGGGRDGDDHDRGRPDRPGQGGDDDRGRGRPDRPDRPGQPGERVQPDRGRPDRPAILPPRAADEPRAEPRRDPPRAEPRRDPPRAEPRRDPPRAEPRRDPPRAEPRRDPPRAEPRRDPPRAEPRRDSPRAEPRRDAPQQKPRSDPEVRRRKP